MYFTFIKCSTNSVFFNLRILYFLFPHILFIYLHKFLICTNVCAQILVFILHKFNFLFAHILFFICESPLCYLCKIYFLITHILFLFAQIMFLFAQILFLFAQFCFYFRKFYFLFAQILFVYLHKFCIVFAQILFLFGQIIFFYLHKFCFYLHNFFICATYVFWGTNSVFWCKFCF